MNRLLYGSASAHTNKSNNNEVSLNDGCYVLPTLTAHISVAIFMHEDVSYV
jgi:hypothetical protein